MSLHFILWLTDGVTSLSSTDRASGASLPYSLPLLYRGYLTASTHTIYATLPEGREAAGLAPLLAQLAFLGGDFHHGTPPTLVPCARPTPTPTNPYRVTFHIPILTASPLTFDLPNTTAAPLPFALPNIMAALWPNMDFGLDYTSALGYTKQYGGTKNLSRLSTAFLMHSSR
jgi:hypothetical protein